MTPKLQDLMNRFLDIDPRTIVCAGLDSFAPYAYVELPRDIDDEVNTLSHDEQLIWDDLTAEYLSELPNSGADNTVKYLKARYKLN